MELKDFYTEYKTSICHYTTNACNVQEQLERRLLISQSAYKWHLENNRPMQADFFKQDVELIKSKLKIKPFEQEQLTLDL